MTDETIKKQPKLEVVSDPFDLSNLRLDASVLEATGVKKLLTTVPVRRPNKQDWVRVREEEDYRENLPMISLKEEREDYVVTRKVLPDLVNEVVYKTIFTTINRQGVLFLWPIKLPHPDDRRKDEWARSE